MKEIILQLMKEISALTSPVSSSALKQVFKSITLPTEEVPEELIPYYALLRKLSIYADQYEESSALINENELKKAAYNKLLEQTQQFKEEFSQLNLELDSSKNAINLFYKTLEPQARQCLPSLSTAPTIDEFGETQKTVVKDYDAYLNKAFKDKLLHYAKLELIYKMNAIDQLIAKLKERDFSIGSDQDVLSLENYLGELTKITRTLTDLKTRWSGDKLKGLQFRFAQELSSKDIKAKEKEITSEMEVIAAELKSIPNQLDSNGLSKEDKISLTESFKTSPDTTALISGYQNQIDGVTSYVSPSKWWGWYQNVNYEKDQKRLKESVAFLQLLVKQRQLELDFKEKETQRNRVSKLLPEQSHIPTDNTNANSGPTDSQQRNDLLIDATELINDLPPFTSSTILTPDSPLTDFFLVLLEQMPVIIDKEERNSTIIALLQELIPLKRSVDGLIAQHKLKLPIDLQYANIEDAEKAKNNFGQPDSEQIAWIEQHKQCEIYFSKAKILEEIIVKVREASNKARELSKQLRENSYKPESEASILQTPGHLITLSKRIESTLSELSQLPALKMDEPAQKPTEEVKLPPVHQPVSEQRDPPKKGSVDQTIFDTHLKSTESNPLKSTPIDEALTGLQSSQSQNLEGSTPVLPFEKPVMIKPELPIQEVQEQTIIKQIAKNHTADTHLAQPVTDHKINLPSIATTQPMTVALTSTGIIEPPLDPFKLQDKPVDISPPKPVLTVITRDVSPSEEYASDRENETSEIDVAYTSEEADDFYALGAQQSGEFHLSQSDQMPSPKETAEKQTPLLGSTHPTNNNLTLKPVKLAQQEEIVVTPEVEDPNSHLLSYYHNLNLSLISHHSTEVQRWYSSLYGAIEKASLDAKQNLKAIHLLKDILFEFQFKQDMNTINSYMRICPTPEEDFFALLKFKPAVAITESETDEEYIFDNCPKELQKFQDQFIHLKVSFPVEAKLFLQAMHSFILIRESIDQSKAKINPSNIPKLSEDPRFEPLKRHRGFIKVWEFFEDIFNWIVGNITQKVEHEYTNRPCFFRTRSSKLLDEADAITQTMLSENSKGTIASLQ
jgi:hypothetical protein